MLIIGIPAGLLFWLANTLVAAGVELLFPGKMAEGNSVLSMFGYAENSFEVALLIFLVCVLAPVGEEIMYRSFAYPPLLMRLGRNKAIIIISLIFAALHLNIWTFFPLFIGGLGFALLYDKFRNVWINICAHSAWNTLVIILYFCG